MPEAAPRPEGSPPGPRDGWFGWTYFAFHPDLIHEVLPGQAKCFRRWAWLFGSAVLFWARNSPVLFSLFPRLRSAGVGQVFLPAAPARVRIERWKAP